MTEGCFTGPPSADESAAQEATKRTLLTAQEVENIRRDERARCAALLDEHAETLGGFVDDPVKAVRLVGLLLSLPHGAAS